jgi:multidrug transporter EmrE-like cation transporter
MIKSIAVLVAYLLSSSAGLLLIKKSTGVLTVDFILGNLLYIVGYVIWIGVILRLLPLSLAFPIASAGLLVASQLTGVIFLGEHFDIYNGSAMLLMLAALAILLVKAEGI